ncbi:cytidine deaminase [Aureibacter tunicatorum]|uniref:Cytidine deaminase n=1 Tax=Aureibacter tunicatorum TaxID=866807 RepID=A0AAE3XNA4_9BACT|nr:cytidine deaminase [Aureibacter tunicatorum]MDR6239025.1 cytidine deaminase [Aureibacter tunicatorum]BDD05049.1 cytidine deaminase [Aureibacter tunicatorum]
MGNKVEKTIEYNLYNSVEELSAEDQVLWESAKRASESAYSPYSRFCVGAAVLMANGEIVIGSNQENAAYPSGLCAERVAFFSASTLYPNVEIKKVAIVAKRFSENEFVEVSPCGSCRQVMVEYEWKQGKNIEILFQGANNKILKLSNVKTLLPLVFTKDNL